MGSVEAKQMEICCKYGADYVAALSSSKIGVAEDVKLGVLPINGLRHHPLGDTSGWYIWAGTEPSNDPEYFKPLHVQHIDEWHPGIKKFLGLAPGWRFQVAPSYEDVWFDSSLLIT